MPSSTWSYLTNPPNLTARYLRRSLPPLIILADLFTYLEGVSFRNLWRDKTTKFAFVTACEGVLYVRTNLSLFSDAAFPNCYIISSLFSSRFLPFEVEFVLYPTRYCKKDFSTPQKHWVKHTWKFSACRYYAVIYTARRAWVKHFVSKPRDGTTPVKREPPWRGSFVFSQILGLPVHFSTYGDSSTWLFVLRILEPANPGGVFFWQVWCHVVISRWNSIVCHCTWLQQTTTCHTYRFCAKVDDNDGCIDNVY